MIEPNDNTKFLESTNKKLFVDIQSIIDEGKQQISQTVNSTLTILYWTVGKRILQDVIQYERADYGKQIIKELSKQLIAQYGKGWGEKQLRHCVNFAEVFPENSIVYALRRQLSWTHFRMLTYIESDLEREFYLQMCKVEKWSTRQLKEKIDSMLFQRTAISKKPDELVKKELETLETENVLSPDLVFKNHYVLDFLNLKDTFSELDFESAILRDIESFLVELGAGFAFVDRQKRMTIDNEDFYLDLLFYNRKLKRLIAIDLKIGKFKPAYKGQMELYLRWLEQNEMEEGEEKPIGLILCAEGNQEQIELLQLDQANIKVAEYITQYIPQELLKQKLHQFTKKARELIDNRE